jgi:hypothetical protein
LPYLLRQAKYFAATNKIIAAAYRLQADAVISEKGLGR